MDLLIVRRELDFRLAIRGARFAKVVSRVCVVLKPDAICLMTTRQKMLTFGGDRPCQGTAKQPWSLLGLAVVIWPL